MCNKLRDIQLHRRNFSHFHFQWYPCRMYYAIYFTVGLCFVISKLLRKTLKSLSRSNVTVLIQLYIQDMSNYFNMALVWGICNTFCCLVSISFILWQLMFWYLPVEFRQKCHGWQSYTAKFCKVRYFK